MTKQEFLEILDKKLRSLSKTEIDDILSEYSQHIDSKVADGKTVEEAIDDFGDIDNLVAEILIAYNVDPDFKIKSIKNKLSYFIENIGEFINKLVDNLTKLNRRELVSIILKVTILIIGLLIIRIPFSIFSESIYNILGFLPNFIVGFVGGILKLIFDIVYLAIVVYVIYVFLKQNLLNGYKAVGVNEEDATINENKVDYTHEEINHKKVKHEYKRVENIPNKDKTYSVTVGDVLYSIIMMIVKVFLFLIMIPIFFVAIGISIVLGIIVSMAFMGYPFIGVSLILLGLSIAFIGIFVAICKFIFKRRKKYEKVFN